MMMTSLQNPIRQARVSFGFGLAVAAQTTRDVDFNYCYAVLFTSERMIIHFDCACPVFDMQPESVAMSCPWPR